MTSIEWTDVTWNPVRGCSRVSAGCQACYAEGVARRFAGPGQPYEGLVRIGKDGKPKAQWNGEVRFVAEHLADPLRWKKPRRVFVNSMSDLFHEALPFEQIAAVFGVMSSAPRHTFQVLTKRPERAQSFFDWLRHPGAADPHATCVWHAMAMTQWRPAGAYDHEWPAPLGGGPWPLQNVWLGVSVEDQRTADERIPVLLSLPAAVRWVSYEPALGPVDFKGWGDRAPAPASDAAPTWNDHVWEDWIPISQRELIEKFWSASYGRGPASWLNDHIVQRVPRTGARLTLGRRGTSSWLDVDKMATAGVTGRYLHMWNNIGRLITDDGDVHCAAGGYGSGWFSKWARPDGGYASKIGWVVVGGESGPGARPFDLAWARSTVRQCREAGVACFVKQLGANPVWSEDPPPPQWTSRKRDSKGGDMSEWPEDLRVREWPEVTRG